MTSFERLTAIRASREPVTIRTSCGKVAYMALESLSQSTATFRQLTIVAAKPGGGQ